MQKSITRCTTGQVVLQLQHSQRSQLCHLEVLHAFLQMKSAHLFTRASIFWLCSWFGSFLRRFLRGYPQPSERCESEKREK